MTEIPTKQRELSFQRRIMDSYDKAGGYARKWASDVQAGVPDLVASLPMLSVGCHLAEVKHRPQWSIDKLPRNDVKNCLTSLQMDVCGRFVHGGALVVAMLVVGGGGRGASSHLGLFDPRADKWDLKGATWYPYVAGEGYDVTSAVQSYVLRG